MSAVENEFSVAVAILVCVFLPVLLNQQNARYVFLIYNVLTINHPK